MGALKGMAVRLRALLRPRARDRELDEEIRFHLDLETEKYLRLGLTPAEARRRALVAFGGVERTREEHRDVRGVRWVEALVADSRYAARTFLRTPALTGAAVLTMALGIGANAAIFSAVNAVILRPLPFPHPERLVMLWEENKEKGWYKNVVAPANLLDWREQVGAFQDVAGYADDASTVTLSGEGAPRLLRVTSVTGNFFSVLGTRAALGRTFVDEETWRAGAPVAVVSDRVWRDHFGSDPGLVGRTIRIEGTAMQVVGVLPPRFSFPAEDVDLWLPVRWAPEDRAETWFRRAHWMRAVARLKPGVSPAQANAQLQHVVGRLKRQYPETNRYMGAGLTSLHEFLVGDTRLPLLVLLSGAGLLLLIACANVGNLLMVRATGRHREVALRLALGASRPRLARQALTESLVLSLLGGAAGLGLGWWGTRALGALQPEGMLRVRDVGMDWSVLAYVLAITTASGLLFGIAPALWSGGRNAAAALRVGGRSGTEGRRTRRWSDALIVGEVALAFLLTAGAGLLVRSYQELRRVDPGFDPDGVLAVSLVLPDTRYDSAAKVRAFYQTLRERAAALPGVSDAALVSKLPLTGTAWTSDFTAAGRRPGEYGSEVAHRVVSPEYFRVMRVPVLRGRPLTAEDRAGAPQAVVINDALARSFFRGQDPIGQRLTFDKVPDSTSEWWTVVGVVGSEHQSGLASPPQIEALFPFAQQRWDAMSLLLRTRGDPVALAPAVRQAVAELDPSLAIHATRAMRAVLADSLARDRFLMMLLLAFAGVGLVLAVVGVYGVLAQLTRSRSREMGIRIALGAPTARVRWQVVRHGLALILAGLGVGGVSAVLATRAMRGLLFQVAPADPATFATVAAVLAATGLVASWLPAARASRADPAVVLRGD